MMTSQLNVSPNLVGIGLGLDSYKCLHITCCPAAFQDPQSACFDFMPQEDNLLRQCY